MNRPTISARRWFRLLLVLACLSSLALAAGATASQPQPDARGVSVTAMPRWGRATPGEWAPYLVTVKNNGSAGVDGEVVLAPSGDAPLGLGATPLALFAPGGANRRLGRSGVQSTGLMLNGRRVTLPFVESEPLRPGSFPEYRAPLALAAGAEKTLVMMVVEAPHGYGARVVDRRRGRVAAFEPPPPPPIPVGAITPLTVALLTSVPDAALHLSNAYSPLEPLLSVTLFSSEGRDFPSDALFLAGLGALVIDDFETAGLSERQRRAVADFVALGGDLILSGGAGSARTLAELPPELTPLRPSGSASASLAALGHPQVTVNVVIGRLQPGARALVTGDGMPLVVEADYGAGRVLQMAYDPLAEPVRNGAGVAGAAWAGALAPVGQLPVRVDPTLAANLPLIKVNPAAAAAAGWTRSSGSVGVVPHDQIWSPAFEAPAWPRHPAGAALGMLGAYMVGTAGLATMMARSRRHTGRLLWALGAAVVLSSMSLGSAGLARSPVIDSVVEVSTLGAGGTVLTTSYHGFVSLARGETTVELAAGTAASTVFTVPNYRGEIVWGPPDLALRGTGGGTVATGGKPAVAMNSRGRVGTLVVQSIRHSGGGLDSRLRLEIGGSPLQGSAGEGGGRVKGTLTNHTGKALLDVRGQLFAGAQAHLASVIPPGATVNVDAPVVAAVPAPPAMADLAAALSAEAKQALDAIAKDPIMRDNLFQAEPPMAAREELIMFAAASRAFTGPSQIVVVGRGELGGTEVRFGQRASAHKIGIFVQALRLEPESERPLG